MRQDDRAFVSACLVYNYARVLQRCVGLWSSSTYAGWPGRGGWNPGGAVHVASSPGTGTQRHMEKFEACRLRSWRQVWLRRITGHHHPNPVPGVRAVLQNAPARRLASTSPPLGGERERRQPQGPRRDQVPGVVTVVTAIQPAGAAPRTRRRSRRRTARSAAAAAGTLARMAQNQDPGSLGGMGARAQAAIDRCRTADLGTVRPFGSTATSGSRRSRRHAPRRGGHGFVMVASGLGWKASASRRAGRP
jgi:hypothetical protein